MFVKTAFSVAIISLFLSTLLLLISGDNQQGFYGVFANSSNCSSNSTNTTCNATENATTTVAPGNSSSNSSSSNSSSPSYSWINVSCPMDRYLGQSGSCTVTLSAAPNGTDMLTVTVWMAEAGGNVTFSKWAQNFSSSSSLTAWYDFVPRAMPPNMGRYKFGWSISGSAASSYMFQPAQNYSMVTIKPLMNITIWPMPAAWYPNGSMTNFSISIASPPPTNGGYITIMPTYSMSSYGEFWPSSIMFQNTGNTSVLTHYVVFKALMPTGNMTKYDMSFPFTGMDDFAFAKLPVYSVGISAPNNTMPGNNTGNMTMPPMPPANNSCNCSGRGMCDMNMNNGTCVCDQGWYTSPGMPQCGMCDPKIVMNCTMPPPAGNNTGNMTMPPNGNETMPPMPTGGNGTMPPMPTGGNGTMPGGNGTMPPGGNGTMPPGGNGTMPPNGNGTTMPPSTTDRGQQQDSTTTSMMAANTTGMMSTTTGAAQTSTGQATSSTTGAPSTTQMMNTTAAPATTKTPPGFLILKMNSKSALTTTQKDNIKAKLAAWLGYPSSLISVGAVDAATGEVRVSLLAPATGSVNTTLVEEAVKKANDLTTAEVGQLGAASVTAKVAGAPEEDDKPDIAVIAGAAAGGLIFLLIILFIIKKQSSGGSGQGYLEDDRPGDKPMLEVPHQQGAQSRPTDSML